MLESDLEKLNKSELIALLIEHEENRCEEKEEMRVGDIIISKNPIKRMGCNKYHEVYQINEQDDDMVFVTQLRCKNKYLDHNVLNNGYSKYVKYKNNFGNSTDSCWEDKDTLYKEYEKFDKNKTYEL